MRSLRCYCEIFRNTFPYSDANRSETKKQTPTSQKVIPLWDCAELISKPASRNTDSSWLDILSGSSPQLTIRTSTEAADTDAAAAGASQHAN